MLPEGPLRQWVLPLPMALRFLLATNPAVLSQVLGVVYRTISVRLLAKAALTRNTGNTGAVTLIQRFGSALNLNVHFHMIFVDGVHLTDGADPPVFRHVPVPGTTELQALVQHIAERIGRMRQNFVENLGRVRSRGGDVELHARPIDPLQLGLSVAYVDAKYTKTVCAGPSTCTSADATSHLVVTEGDRLPGAPWTIHASAEYSFGPVHDRKPYLRVDSQVSTPQTTELPIQDSNNGVSDPAYTGPPKIETLQVRAGMRWNGFDLSLFGNNLTDSHPLLSQTRDTTASDLFFAHTIRPRTVGVTVSYRY